VAVIGNRSLETRSTDVKKVGAIRWGAGV